MRSDPRRILESIFKGSSEPSTKVLLRRIPDDFSADDLIRVKQEILRNVPPRVSLPKIFSTLNEMLMEVCPLLATAQMRTVSISYPTPSNPFANGVRTPDETYEEAVAWFAERRNDGKHNGSSLDGVEGTAALFKLFLISSILEFEILDLKYVPALIGSLKTSSEQTRSRRVPLHRTLAAVPLSLPGRGQTAEERLFIAGEDSLVLLNEFLAHSDSVKLLDLLSAAGRPLEASEAIMELERISNQHYLLPNKINIPKLIEAARKVAILHLPPAVVAHRSCEFISHSLRLDVLKRVGDYDIPPFDVTSARILPAKAGQRSQSTEPSDPRSGPAWLRALREALPREAPVDRVALQQLAKGVDPIGACMGNFALSLLKSCSPSTIHKYVSLIATRLMPRLESGNPADVDEDTWEEVIEQILDEDEFFRGEDLPDPGVRRSRGHSQSLLRAMHSFLRFLKPGATEASKLHEKIPALGLMQVDANLVTVDEYKAALRWLGSVAVYPDAHIIQASRVALILGYRLGLRRAESAFLRLGDFDEADHLHIRPWQKRKLKTSNARRDLPVAVLIPKDELDQVKRWIAKIRKRAEEEVKKYDSKNRAEKTRTWKDALLFASRKDPFRQDDFEAIVARVQEAVRVKKDDFPENKKFHYHLLRHSFANMMLLKLWKAMHPVARKILHRHPETLTWINNTEDFRIELFGTNRIRGMDLQAIALLMGHGSSATTLEHYLHVMDWYRPGGTEAVETKKSAETELGGQDGSVIGGHTAPALMGQVT